MLFTYQQAEYLEKHLEPIQNSNKYIARNPESIPNEDKKRLLDLDKDCFELFGYHLIVNYEELANQIPIPR